MRTKYMHVRRMIPSDIITQILCRLPSKSVARFRSVSKEWLSLLTKPKFIETHRKTLDRNHHMFTDEKDVLNVLYYSHPFDHDESYIKPTSKLFPIELTRIACRIRITGSCDGLLLVYLGDSDMDGFEEEFVLLNPTTGEFMQLPPSVRDYPCKWNNQESVRFVKNYGFGYDSVTDDYKVIIFTYFVYYVFRLPEQVTGITLVVSIYSLKSNTWRKLMIVDNNPDYVYNRSSDVVYLNGFLHWIIKKKNGSKVIVAFSLADECLSEVPSPNCGNHTDIMSSDYCRLVLLGGKLAIYKGPLRKRGEQNINLWLMKEYGDKESWTNIPLDMFNGHELCMSDSMIFDDHGKIRVSSGETKQILIYDFEKGKFSKDAYVWSRTFQLFGSYVESLVSPRS